MQEHAPFSKTPVSEGSTTPFISVIIPCYNEEAVLKQTHERICEVLCPISAKRACPNEIIYVNDGSSDATLSILESFLATSGNETSALSDQIRVRVISLSRNFGHQAALTAGMDAAQGQTLVLIDADLQDPPELIPDMLELYEQGYDVVYAQRKFREGESAFKIFTASIFYRILNTLSDTAIPKETGDFRLISRRVADVMLSLPENDRFLRGMIPWLGFSQIPLPYDRAPRLAGDSKYPLRKMLSFALTGILSFSVKPLRLASYLGFSCAGISILGILYALTLRLFTQNWVEGWTLLIIAILFMGGVQLICLGIAGEYIGRLYAAQKKRPLYIAERYEGYVRGEVPKYSRSPLNPAEVMKDIATPPKTAGARK